MLAQQRNWCATCSGRAFVASRVDLLGHTASAGHARWCQRVSRQCQGAVGRYLLCVQTACSLRISQAAQVSRQGVGMLLLLLL